MQRFFIKLAYLTRIPAHSVTEKPVFYRSSTALNSSNTAEQCALLLKPALLAMKSLCLFCNHKKTQPKLGFLYTSRLSCRIPVTSRKPLALWHVPHQSQTYRPCCRGCRKSNRPIHYTLLL